MKEPILVIMAAGMGSRFGGLKQITAVDENGHALIDFSLYDARRAGFKKVVFLIKREIDKDFRDAIGTRMERYFDVKYVYQELDMLPEEFLPVPAGREKPWGTGHAISCCRDVIDGPFAVINADDFYGAAAYSAIFDFLRRDRPESEYVMIGYRLKNTVTDSGTVARGVCSVANGYLTDVTEYTKIAKRGEDAAYTLDGVNYIDIPGSTIVSMNLWGFSQSMPGELWRRFPAFLREHLTSDPLRCEYLLPAITNDLLKEGRCSVRVLECGEVWHGMTYREDLDAVKASIAAMKSAGVYPDKLWDQSAR